MKCKALPTQKYLKECFTYDPETGLLYWKHRPVEHFKTVTAWKIWNSKYPDTLALNTLRHGYLTGEISNEPVFAHRVIYKMWYGEEPEFILHKHGNTQDNRIENFSTGSHELNMKDKITYKNNTSGVKGVSFHKPSGKWRAYISKDRKVKALGLYTDIEDAIAARKAAEVELGYISRLI